MAAKIPKDTIHQKIFDGRFLAYNKVITAKGANIPKKKDAEFEVQ